MTITSISFFVIVAVLIILFYVLPHQCQKILLLLATIVFCLSTGGISMIVTLFFSIITTWAGSLLIEKAVTLRKKRVVLGFTLILNIGILFSTKYINFFVYTGRILANIFNFQIQLNEITILAPLGLSFFMLQVIGYLIDVYRGVVVAQKNFLTYALFASYFPQLVQGPINRYGEIIESLTSPKTFDYNKLMYGLQRMLWGLFKKLVIAERLTVIANTIYTDFEKYKGLYIIYGTVCFAFQLYADFSGAIDIVLGCSEALGIKMAENFNNPFLSRSISEYWRRWHITLGTWMKDYVFYPLLRSKLFMNLGMKSRKLFGKKRGKNMTTYLGMFFLWFTVGIWHGGAWKYIIGSGLLHYFYIVSGQLLHPVFHKIVLIFNINKECILYKCFEIVRTFLLVCIGFVFFRASSTSVALQMLRNSLKLSADFFIYFSQIKMGLDFEDWVIGMISLLVLIIVRCVKVNYIQREKPYVWL